MSAIVPATNADIVEKVVIAGDLSKLAPGERVAYYQATCQSLGLNPLTRPFEYITLNGKLTLYARREATDQLRKLHGVSIQITDRERIDSVYVVTARATDKDGRIDESTGAVTVGNLQGDAMANALMKAETKAKRRVTLSIVGLGWLDETEIETIRDARPVQVDANTGEIVDAPAVTVQGNGHSTTPTAETGTFANAAQLKRLNQIGSQVYGADWETVRHDMAAWASKDRTRSSKELTPAEADTLIRGIERKIEAKKAEAAAKVPAPTNGEQEALLEEAAAANAHSTWGAQAL